MEPQIPQHLLPTRATEDVKVGVVNETGPDNSPVRYEDVAKIGRELGVITLSSSMMDSLQRVGADMHRAGVVTVTNGLAYVPAAAMTQILLLMVQDALKATPKERQKIAQVMAQLGGAIDKQNRTLKMDHVGQKGGGEGVPPLKTNFQPHQHVHFHKHETLVQSK